MCQSRAPLWDAVVAYADNSIMPFHTPGHKLRSGVFSIIHKQLGSSLFALDASDELECVACDHRFEDVLDQAQVLAAQLFGARATRFLVNGTTSGIHSMLLPVDGQVIVPRFSHQSVYSALMLSNATPIYVPTEFDTEWSIPLAPSIDQIKPLVEKYNPTAAIFTYPSYYGMTPDLGVLCPYLKKRGVVILVDEAHGAHFHFSKQLPNTALALGADLVAQSTHKTLGSLTQSSMLHIGDASQIHKQDVALAALQTTSPSLLFLAILDVIRRELSEKGTSLVESAIALAYYLGDQLAKIPGVQVLSGLSQQDPTKIVFSLTKLGLNGNQVENILRNDYNIQVELSDWHNVLALVTIGDTIESVQHLVDSLDNLAFRYRRDTPSKVLIGQYPSIPARGFGLRDAFYRPDEQIGLADSLGRMCAGFVTPYPPGVPLIVPGEIIDQDTLQYMDECIRKGFTVRGLNGKNVSVIKE